MTDPMTFTDLAVQATAAVILILLCDMAKRHIKRAIARRIAR